MHHHFVSFGVPGFVGRFQSSDGHRYPRGKRVVCRTPRGLEVGTVLNQAEPADDDLAGTLLRVVTVEDDLLLARLEKHRDEAFHACQRLLTESDSTAVLVDVEQLFDGESLILYFLGDTDEQLNTLTQQLANAYESKVQFQRFAQTLADGCGPDCGTEQAAGSGCGFGGCSSCSVAAACHK